MEIKAIIFDIDGVLADSRKAVVCNTKTLLEEYGFPVESSDIERMSSAHSAETVLTSLAPRLLQEPDLLKKMLARLSEITRDNLHLVKPTQLARETPRLAKKYRLAAASNRKSSAGMVLEKLGIRTHFETVVTSADAPPKPDPGMIRLALERLCVEPDEALFVGDNVEDRLAGEAAGVKTLMIDGTKRGAKKKLFALIAEEADA